MSTPVAELVTEVRRYVFERAAATGNVPQSAEIARNLNRAEADVKRALVELGEGKVLILAPNADTIWAANPFCAVPSGFRVHCEGRAYWGICIWDALGIPAALSADAVIAAPCGDCGERLQFEVRNGELVKSEGVVHFAVPARRWWDNIGFT
jgi:hypothetical protein